ncbi:MAG: hypothetical protein Q9191_001094 [Dirinaria sp. TL-2023a]
MAPPSIADSDPFKDPIAPLEEDDALTGSTLVVGRDASLTLATDSLIVLDSKTTQAIPFFNILWAEISEFELIITYAKPTSKKVVRVASINYLTEKTDRRQLTAWTARLLDRAYGKSQRKKRIKVLINPFSGKGKAPKWYLRDIAPIFAAARCEIDVERTRLSGHAVEIAEKLNLNDYDVIASCSGDGLPHEVFNGLGKRKDARRALSKVAVVQLPCGSGNAMSCNLNGTDSTSLAALCVVKGIRTPLDLVSITQGDTRTLSFLSQSLGIVAEVDLGTEHIRWMGSARFTYGFLARFLAQKVYPCDVAVKVDIPTKASVREHYRKEVGNQADNDERRENMSEDNDYALPELEYGSIKDPLPSDWSMVSYDQMGNFFAGNMAFMAPDANFFPASLPNDGHLDLVTVDGDISRVAAIQSLLAVENGKFFDMPHVTYRKISGYRIRPKDQKQGYISIDGERFPFEPFQAEVHRGLGTVLSKTGHVYEAPGVAPITGA